MKLTSKYYYCSIVIIMMFSLFISSCEKDNKKSLLVKDSDGNVYHTITIGTQTWMVEDLHTTKYNDGTIIPNVTDTVEWANLIIGAYYNNNDISIDGTTCGLSYNWYCINTGKLAPIGWHIPTDEEWITLTVYLMNNGFCYQGCYQGDPDIAKSLAATTGWSITKNEGTPGYDQLANNSSGFTAFPCGYIYWDGTIRPVGERGSWWSSSEYNTESAFCRLMEYYQDHITRTYNNKKCGFSVRCIKD